jgi:hypothetical protein
VWYFRTFQTVWYFLFFILFQTMINIINKYSSDEDCHKIKSQIKTMIILSA